MPDAEDSMTERRVTREELLALPGYKRIPLAQFLELDVAEWLAARGVHEVPPVDEALRRIVLRSRALRSSYLRWAAGGFLSGAKDGPFNVGHDLIADRAAGRPYDRPPAAAKEIPTDHVLVAIALSAWLGLGSTRTLITATLGVDDGKVLQAKLDRLIRRGHLDGCTCGCRGDFVPVGLDDGLGMMHPALSDDGVPDSALPEWAR